MAGLIHCIYTSAATSSFTSEALVDLLQHAREHNQTREITGVLLYSNRNFFQVLEGLASQVDSCFDRIEHDSRHTRVTRIIREAITHRSFADWSMGFAEFEPAALREVDGLNDFFGTRACFDALDAGRAKRLLAAFASGRWHATLSERPVTPKPL